MWGLGQVTAQLWVFGDQGTVSMPVGNLWKAGCLLARAVSTQNLAVTLPWGCFVSQHVLPHSLYLWEELGLAAPRAFSGSVGPEGGAGVGSGNLWPRLWEQGRQVAKEAPVAGTVVDLELVPSGNQ